MVIAAVIPTRNDATPTRARRFPTILAAISRGTSTESSYPAIKNVYSRTLTRYAKTSNTPPTTNQLPVAESSLFMSLGYLADSRLYADVRIEDVLHRALEELSKFENQFR